MMGKMKDLMFFILTKWKWLSSILLFFSLPYYAHSQLLQPARYEVEIKDASEQFHVLANQNSGLLLFKNMQVHEKRVASWQFIKLDSSLNELWRQEIAVDHALELGLYKTYKGHAFFLFTGAGTYNIKVLNIDLDSGISSIYEVRNFIPLKINAFEITDDAILVGGQYNLRPVIVYYNFRSQRTHLLPNLYSIEGELNHVATNEDNSIDVVVSGMDPRKNKVLSVYSFDNNGKMIEKNTLFPDGKKSLQFGRIITHDNRKIIAGTYGRRRSEFSRGLFIAELHEDKKDVKYYNYADLTNFFEYMKSKRVRRIKDRITRRKEAGKKLRFNYRLLVQDILKAGDDYVLVAEAFYPKYKNYHHYSHYRSDFANLVFDGYRYTHAVLVGFNSAGKIMWDNCFKISDVQSLTLDKVVEVAAEDEKLLLFYNHDNQLNTKIIRKNDVVKDKTSDKIQLKYENDMVKENYSTQYSTQKSGVIKWDDNSFYAYGVQKIKNIKNEGVKLNREVFFINKVIYK